MIGLLTALGLGYLLGSLPSAELIARSQGKTIFEVGSGNMGAMNTARNLGWGAGAAVLALDLGKGALASWLGIVMVAASQPDAPWAVTMPLAAGLGAVIGHAASVYVGFRGGKALTTALGMSLPLFPVAGLYSLLLLVSLVLLLRKVGVGSSLAALCFPAVVYTQQYQAGISNDVRIATAITVALISTVIIVKHLPDISRELRKTK
jgi:acyl phosphate:glycerol-3-phosphate acyltransferase